MGNSLFFVFGVIAALFLILLFVKAIFGFRFCVLCVGVCFTWVALLLLARIRLFDDSVLTALLVGNSVVGAYYLVEKKMAEKFHVFRLPFFLTLLFAGYFLLVFPPLDRLVSAGALLAFLWFAFGLLYVFAHRSALRSVVSHIIRCCKNW